MANRKYSLGDGGPWGEPGVILSSVLHSRPATVLSLPILFHNILYRLTIKNYLLNRINVNVFLSLSFSEEKHRICTKVCGVMLCISCTSRTSKTASLLLKNRFGVPEGGGIRFEKIRVRVSVEAESERRLFTKAMEERLSELVKDFHEKLSHQIANILEKTT